MKKIGLISDTHNFIDPSVYSFFEPVDEIWHAGDIGSLELADKLREFKPLRAVFGNVDNHEVRLEYPEHLRFRCEEVDVWMTHIGGHPNRYERQVKPEIYNNPPQLFISGHSHILKVIRDEKLGLLHINPGAAGNHGFHFVKTLLRFAIDGSEIKELEVKEISR